MPAPNPSLAEYTRRINRVLRYIDAHLDETLTLETLAREAFFSPFHFHRLFTAMLGEPPATWIARVRVEKAANMLLTNPAMSITAVALACGYSSSATFARAFREWASCTASAWRAQGGAPGDNAQKSKLRKTGSKRGKVPRRSDGYVAFDATSASTTPIRSIIMNIEVKSLPGHHVAYVMHIGEYANVGTAWQRLCAWAGPRGLLGAGTAFLGMSWDNPDITPADKLRYAACVTVPPGTATPDDIATMTIPAGRHAVARFEGPGDRIRNAYMELYGQWLPQSGFVPDDRPPYEVYLSDPADGMFVMDICLPVKEIEN